MPAISQAFRCFDEVARRGSVRKAAVTLHLTPAAVNQQILNLEALVGVPLFDRLPRGMQLTTAGELMLASVRRSQRDFDNALAQIDLKPASVPMVSNVIAEPVSAPSDLRRVLVDQVTGTVRWRGCVDYMAAQEVEAIYELGAGNVLSGLVKRINRDIKTGNVGTPGELEELAKLLA